MTDLVKTTHGNGQVYLTKEYTAPDGSQADRTIGIKPYDGLFIVQLYSNDGGVNESGCGVLLNLEQYKQLINEMVVIRLIYETEKMDRCD